jgi:hypothetical protein
MDAGMMGILIVKEETKVEMKTVEEIFELQINHNEQGNDES